MFGTDAFQKILSKGHWFRNDKIQNYVNLSFRIQCPSKCKNPILKGIYSWKTDYTR